MLDELYRVQCRILHVSSGDQLHTVCDALENHFTTVGSPVMMGGDSDNMSKGIVGMCVGKSKTYLLVVVSMSLSSGGALLILVIKLLSHVYLFRNLT